MKNTKNIKPIFLNSNMEPALIILNFGFPALLVLHLILLFLFSFFKSLPLSILNIFSVLIFSISIIYFQKTKKVLLPMILTLIEALIFIPIIIYYTGWNSGFQYWVLILSSIIFMANINNFKLKIFLLLVIFFDFIFVFYYLKNNPPVYQLQLMLRNFLYFSNVTLIMISISTILFLSHLFSEKQETLSSEKNDKIKFLLYNLFPQNVADFFQKNKLFAEKFTNCSVMIAKIEGLSKLSSKIKPEKYIKYINDIYSLFDDILTRNGVEKIKTSGDTYIAASGLYNDALNHALSVSLTSMEIIDSLNKYNKRHKTSFKIKIGVSSGSVFAGIVGKKKLCYDIWGDTVSTTKKIQSHGVSGKVHIGQRTADLLDKKISIRKRGIIKTKKNIEINTYILQHS